MVFIECCLAGVVSGEALQESRFCYAKRRIPEESNRIVAAPSASSDTRTMPAVRSTGRTPQRAQKKRGLTSERSKMSPEKDHPGPNPKRAGTSVYTGS